MVQTRKEQISFLAANLSEYTYTVTAGTTSTNLPVGFEASTVTKTSGGNYSSNPAIRGIVTTGSGGFVRIKKITTGIGLLDGSVSIFGRMSYSGGTYTVTYKKISAGVEVSATLPGAGSYSVSILFPEVMDFDEQPVNVGILLAEKSEVGSVATAGSSSSSGISESVADRAALAALADAALPDETLVYVQSYRDPWILNRALDATGLDPNLAVAAASASGAWERLLTHPVSWRLQSDWHISAAGDDEAVGDAAAPLATYAEFNRRVGGLALAAQTVTFDDEGVWTEDITILNQGDAASNAYLALGGTKTVLYSGTITATSPTNPATGFQTTITDSALPVSWTASGLVGHIGTIVGGARAGLAFVVCADLGTKTARITQPSDSDITPVEPQVGDAFEICTYTTLTGTHEWTAQDCYWTNLSVNGSFYVTRGEPNIFASEFDITGFLTSSTVTQFSACRITDASGHHVTPLEGSEINFGTCLLQNDLLNTLHFQNVGSLGFLSSVVQGAHLYIANAVRASLHSYGPSVAAGLGLFDVVAPVVVERGGFFALDESGLYGNATGAPLTVRQGTVLFDAAGAYIPTTTNFPSGTDGVLLDGTQLAKATLVASGGADSAAGGKVSLANATTGQTRAATLVLGTNSAGSGVLQLPNNSAIKARNAANSSATTLANLNTSDVIINGDDAVCAGFETRAKTGSVWKWLINNVEIARLNATQLLFGETITASVSLGTRTSDAACTTLTIQGQSPYASATGSNRNPGNIVLAIPAPAAGGTRGYIEHWDSGTKIGELGALDSATVYTVRSATGATGGLRLQSQGTNFVMKSSGISEMHSSKHYWADGSDVYRASLTLNTSSPTWNWDEASTGTFGVDTRTSDAVVKTLTIKGQGAYASAATNKVGGKVVIAGGTGSVAGTNKAGDVQIDLGTSVAYDSAKFSIMVDGTSILDMGMFGGLSNRTQLQAVGTALRFVSPTGFEFYLAGSGKLDFGATSGTAWAINATGFSFSQSFAGTFGTLARSSDAATNELTVEGQTAYASAATNVNAGNVRIRGGAAKTDGTTGLRGGVKLGLSTSTMTMIEASEVAVGRRLISLCRASDITTTEMPANTGDLVTYLGNAATAPTANPVGGLIVYGQAGVLATRSPNGVQFAVTPELTSSASVRFINQVKQITTTDATPTAIASITVPDECLTNLRWVLTSRGANNTDYQIVRWMVPILATGGSITVCNPLAYATRNTVPFSGISLSFSSAGLVATISVTGIAATTIRHTLQVDGLVDQ